jgi:hypothetical protein
MILLPYAQKDQCTWHWNVEDAVILRRIKHVRLNDPNPKYIDTANNH